MPAVSKNIKYKNEQDAIVDRMIEILELDQDNSFTLYELDHNPEKQQAIMNLRDDIKKYFSLAGCNGVSRPANSKRPYLSIIKNIMKQRYEIKPIERQYDNIKTTSYIIML